MKKVLVGMMSVCMLALVGCGQQNVPTPTGGDETAKPTPTQKEEVIKIGVIAPLAGGAAVYGEDATYAYNYVFDKINADGGINGNKVELIYEDGKCNGKDATTAVQKLINVDGVKLILGGVCSAETIPAGKIAEQSQVLMLSSVSSSPEISGMGDYIFRYWNDLNAAGVMATYLKDTGATKVAFIIENNDYSINYMNVVKDNFDGEIVLEEKVNAEEKDLTIIAKKLANIADEVDNIIFIPVNESLSSAMFTALKDEGVLDTSTGKIIGGEVMLNKGLLESFGTTLDGAKTVVFGELEGADATKDLLAGHEVKSSDTFVVLWADAAELMAEAIEEVGYDATAVRDYIAGFNAESPRSSLVGDFYFDENGDGQGLEFVVKEAKDGELVAVE